MGRVHDREGRALDGVAVHAEVDGKVRDTVTDATGFYAFLDLTGREARLYAGPRTPPGQGVAVKLAPGKAVRQDLAAGAGGKP